MIELAVADVLTFHQEAMRHGGGSGTLGSAHDKIEGALESAATAAAYAEASDPTLVYAAAILRNLAASHPFVDGNKRTAWLCCVGAIQQNGYELACPSDEAATALCLDVLLQKMSLEAIVTRLDAWIAMPP